MDAIRLPGLHTGVIITIPAGWAVWKSGGVRYQREPDGTVRASDGDRDYLWASDLQMWTPIDRRER